MIGFPRDGEDHWTWWLPIGVVALVLLAIAAGGALR